MGRRTPRFRRIGTENAFAVGPLIARIEKETGKRVIRCNLGEPDFDPPPHVIEAVISALRDGHTHYCDAQGLLPLREVIAQDTNTRLGMDVSPDQVVIMPGAKPAIGACMNLYCGLGDEVVYPSPGFPIYESMAGFVGADCKPLLLREEEGFSFTGRQLARLIRGRIKVIVICSPSNPTGGVLSRDQLVDIARVIREKGHDKLRVFSDEVYEHILFDGRSHYSIATVDPVMLSKTIIVSGVSKTFAWTGGRVGWAIMPTVDEARWFTRIGINEWSCVAPDHQMGAKCAIEMLGQTDHVAEMVAKFQERRDFLVPALNGIEGITCQKPGGAFYVFPNIAGVCDKLGVGRAHDGLPDETQDETSLSTMFQMFLLFKHGVATMDRRSFGHSGSEDQHFLRLSFATGMDDLRKAVDRIATAAEDVDGFAEFVEEDGPFSY